VDDCTKFVLRQARRKVFYDGIIMDPPAFGRDQKGKIFEFEKQILELVYECKKLLSNRPLFFIFNGYSMGYSATVLKNILCEQFKCNNIEFGELQIRHANEEKTMPCSLFARIDFS